MRRKYWKMSQLYDKKSKGAKIRLRVNKVDRRRGEKYVLLPRDRKTLSNLKM